MSLRPRRNVAAPVAAIDTSPGSRFHFVLTSGLERQNRAASVGMMGDMHSNRGAVPMAHMHTTRKIMMLKGLVFGIPDAKYAEAFAAASAVIAAEGITTICWDGDKYTYPGEGGSPAAASFTRLLVALQAAMPHLEFIYFKKEGKASGLITGMAEPEADKFGNVLGPFPFMTAQNTKIGKSTDAAPPKITGMNYGIEFAGEMKWYELGLKGLMYIKDVLGVPSVTYMVFGLGGAVTKELEKVAETPSAYPAGITKDKVKIIEVIRA